MTPEEFVEVVVRDVYEAAWRGAESNMMAPPGRHPSEALMGLSRWHAALSPSAQQMVASAMRSAADHAVFGLLALLDGSRRVASGGRVRLVLEARDPQGSVLLNDPPAADLHDLYREQVSPQPT